MTQPKQDTPSATGTEQPDEQLKFFAQGDRRIEVGNAITTRSMARRLPQLMRRSFTLGCQVDRNSVIVLLTCAVVSGVLEAFGLIATTGVIKPIIASGEFTSDQLLAAAPRWP